VICDSKFKIKAEVCVVRVLIVDDSASMRLFLERIFSTDPEISVAGSVQNGEEALAAVERLAPDVVTMDIYMPRMSGLDATRRIMETRPTPIIILSGNLDPEEVRTSFQAMEAGALTALPKPPGVGHPDHETEVASLVRKVKLLSEVKVVKRWPRGVKVLSPAPVRETGCKEALYQPRVVAMGASTGGPVVIQRILSGLDAGFSIPILIVQHMATGFVYGFAEWLALSSRLPVHVAAGGEHILPGHVYVAPDGFHMLAEADGSIKLDAAPPENGLRPSVSALFRSVAGAYGKNSVGVLLTGMGSDGAEELLALRRKGAVTIVQDEASSVIYGMPGEAVRIGAATHIMPTEKIARMLGELAGERVEKKARIRNENQKHENGRRTADQRLQSFAKKIR
jgi:two-component system chemotaxis response regulator CheB